MAILVVESGNGVNLEAAPAPALSLLRLRETTRHWPEVKGPIHFHLCTWLPTPPPLNFLQHLERKSAQTGATHYQLWGHLLLCERPCAELRTGDPVDEYSCILKLEYANSSLLRDLSSLSFLSLFLVSLLRNPSWFDGTCRCAYAGLIAKSCLCIACLTVIDILQVGAARANVWNYLVPGTPILALGASGFLGPVAAKPGSALPRAPPQNALLRGNSPNRGKCGWRESHSLVPCLLRAYNRLGANFYQMTARLTQHQSMVKRAPFDVQALQHSRFRNIGPWALATTITDSPPPPPPPTTLRCHDRAIYSTILRYPLFRLLGLAPGFGTALGFSVLGQVCDG